MLSFYINMNYMIYFSGSPSHAKISRQDSGVSVSSDVFIGVAPIE